MPEDWEKYWKSKNILNRIVDFMRINYFADIPPSYLGNMEGKTILEAGCGTSESLVRIAKKAKKVTGIDISEKALERSRINFIRSKVQKKKYSLVLGDIQKMKFKDNTFDITFNTGVVEHFDDDKINSKPIEEMVRVTKKGGKIVILVPSIYSPYYIYYLFTRIPGLNGLFPWEAHRFYTYKMLKNQLKALNLNFKIRLNFKSLFLYIVAIIRK
ncbi:class I SAM-dependent methyltransferase [Candidatus Woesearchaeota archaeon]|nr:class I SAM-dependent methyltransferase [Candidatus Woesearchaeota archaeon]